MVRPAISPDQVRQLQQKEQTQKQNRRSVHAFKQGGLSTGGQNIGKVRKCNYFILRGSCRSGADCRWSHGGIATLASKSTKSSLTAGCKGNELLDSVREVTQKLTKEGWVRMEQKIDPLSEKVLKCLLDFGKALTH